MDLIEEMARVEVAHLSGLTLKGVNKRKWGEIDASIKAPYWEYGLTIAKQIHRIYLKHGYGIPDEKEVRFQPDRYNGQSVGDRNE